jgi:hypothetical protein
MTKFDTLILHSYILIIILVIKLFIKYIFTKTNILSCYFCSKLTSNHTHFSSSFFPTSPGTNLNTALISASSFYFYIPLIFISGSIFENPFPPHFPSITPQNVARFLLSAYEANTNFNIFPDTQQSIIPILHHSMFLLGSCCYVYAVLFLSVPL